MLMGFILHFYIIFGTNLLTGGPAQIVVFLPIKTESKRNETFRRVIFGTNAIQETWSGRKAINEAATRQGARPPPGCAHPPWARPPPSWAPRCSTDLLLPPIYISIYPTNIQEHHETLFPPPQPSVPKRSHLGAFFGAPPEGASITEGLYINSMAPPMMCE